MRLRVIWHSDMEKSARKPSADPVQQKLRERKAIWNKATSEFIARIIAFKKAINGRGDAKFGLPTSNIKNPLPPEVISFLSELTSNYQALAQEAASIAQEQEAYSQERRQTAKIATASVQDAPHRVGEVTLGSTTLKTLLALTPEQRERGLMYVREPTVMSFQFDRPIINKFWMRNTPAPLDIIFARRGQIIDICYGEPFSTRMVGPDDISDVVVEVPHGTCAKHGITIGDSLNLSF